ncbi:Flagellin [Comamonas aquatilis]|uniref:flagellin N-terminal helical domain-containing protein n=1 Tax=Comamonas aquatilis TaxID=1778406 RepID=UPI0039F03874
MAAIINTNIQSLNAQRSLSSSQSQLATSMQRLSSGLRINSAKDDAAGLAISERMTTQVRGLTVAMRNANDGISLAQTAEGALNSLGGNLQRIRELAVQSRNATNSAEDRAALDTEVQQLKAEVSRIAQQTSFNGTMLLDGSFTNMAFQVGANQGQTIDVSAIVNANVDALGSWKSVDVPATVKGDSLKAGIATPTTSTASGVFTPALLADAGNAKLVVGGVEIINKTTTTAGEITAADIDAALALKKDELRDAGISFSGKAVGSGDLTFTKADGTSFDITTTAALGSFVGADFAAGTNPATTKGTTAFPPYVAGDLVINGKNIILSEATNAVDRGKQMVEAINTAFPDGSVKASLVGGRLTLVGSTDVTVGGPKAADAGLSETTTKFIAGKPEVGFGDVNIKSAESADNAILAMDAALTAVNGARATLGAIQSRFETTVENLSVNAENLSASRSRIMDADFAAETANLSRTQILQQAGTAMVAQANQLPQQVLKLLQG